MRKWLPLIILASAQFIMVLDSSVMNVSISQIVADLNTTITGVQLAITMYTLVMAAFMLVGAKLGDILGRDRAFAIGPRRLRARLADDGAQPEPDGAADRLVADRGPRRRARDPGDRRADRRELRGQGARVRLRDDRRRRRCGDRRRAADRRLRHDDLQLALRLRRRGRGRDRSAPRPPSHEARAAAGAARRSSTRRRRALGARARPRSSSAS